MALNFPDSPTANVTTHTVGDVIYTWDGEKWRAAAVPIEPPDLTSVAIAEDSGNSNRFTSSEFTVTPTIAEDGNPSSAKDLKISITPDIIATPITDSIQSIGTASVTDGVKRLNTNDNSWNSIIWCGAPYNHYLAQGTGTSTQNIITSPDGITWTRRECEVSGSPTNPYSIIAWCPLDGRLYMANRRYTGGSTTVCQWYKANQGTYNFILQGDVSMPGNNTNDSHFSWNNLTWDYYHERWFIGRTSGQNSRHGGFTRGPTTANWSSGWTDLGSACGSEDGRFQIHQDGSATFSITASNQGCGNSSSGWTGYWASPNSSGSYTQIITGGYAKKGRMAKVGTAGWMAVTTGPSRSPGRGSYLCYMTGGTPSNSFTKQNLESWSTFSDITYADMQDCIWIPELGIGVACGQMSTSTRDKEGVLLVTSDCVNWTRHWTNESGDTSQYRWRYMHWNADRNELVLVADAGTFPAGRAGYSKTVFQAANFTELTFVAATGLNNFSTGTAITQSDNNATGAVVEVDEDAGTMAIDTFSGTFTTNQTVEADAINFTKGYLVFDSNGNVSGISPSDPGWTRMNGNGPYTITMPATFDDGNAPDTSCIAGSAISTEMRLISTSQGFTATDTSESSDITPT